MHTIYKYPIEIVDRQELPLPEDTIMLKADMQDGVLCTWAIVDPEKPIVPTEILIFGTGQTIPSNLRLQHLGTVLNGLFVWHVFKNLGDA